MAFKPLTPERKAEKDLLKAQIEPLNQEILNHLAKTLVGLPSSHFAPRDYGKTTFMQEFDVPLSNGGKAVVGYCVRVYDPKTSRKRAVAELDDLES